jgi:hypothetical protein
MERRHRRVERLGDFADRAGADRAPEQGQQDLADLARREAEDEAGQDGAVDLGRTPCIGLEHPLGAEAPCPRHFELDVAEFGQQMAPITAIAAIRRLLEAQPVQPFVDSFLHPAFDDLDQCLTTQRAIALAPFQPVSAHCLHHRECVR